MLIQHHTLSINSKEWHIVTLTVAFIHYIAVLCFFVTFHFVRHIKQAGEKCRRPRN